MALLNERTGKNNYLGLCLGYRITYVSDRGDENATMTGVIFREIKCGAPANECERGEPAV